MKKLLIATAALSLMCGSAFAQGSTGPAAQQDNTTKPGMTKDSTDKGAMTKSTTGMDKGRHEGHHVEGRHAEDQRRYEQVGSNFTIVRWAVLPQRPRGLLRG